MNTDTVAALVDALTEYERVVEVGIGNRPAVAESLAANEVVVTATDIHERPVPDGVEFVVDDVTEPDLSVYENAEAIYALNIPPELHRALRDVVRAVAADCLFTTLGGDAPAVAARPVQVPGETIYRVD